MSKPIPNEVKALNTIAKDTSITGKIESDGDLRFDGILNGDLICKGRVVLGPESAVNGNIRCNNAEIMGRVTGDVVVVELLSLRNTASLSGDIMMSRLSIEPGATFTGNCRMYTPDQSDK